MPAPILDRPFPLLTGIATVARRAAITPRMARFTLVAPAFAELGVEEPGEILTLGWCDRGEELVMPERGWRFPRGRPEQHWRNFTVRAHRPQAAEVNVDFFLHGDAGWASRGGREPGTTTALADALAALPAADGPVQVWGGGEALAMRAVREHVRGLDVVASDVIGYWKHRTTPDDVDD